MLKNVAPASSYFYLPIEDEVSEDEGEPPLESTAKTYALDWAEEKDVNSTQDDQYFTNSSASSSSSSLASDVEGPSRPLDSTKYAIIQEILSQNDLYKILGVSRKSSLDRFALRRAYLSRSKACHPE